VEAGSGVEAHQADPAAGAENAVPRQRRAFGERVQRVSHLTRGAGHAGDRSDLTVGGDTAAGDPTNGGVDTGVAVGDRARRPHAPRTVQLVEIAGGKTARPATKSFA
jgi:hypothetical protein